MVLALSAHAGSFNGSGTFVRSYSWTNDAANGIPITASRFDTEDDGFATGLSTCITKNGQTTLTGNIPMSGFLFTGVGNATARTMFAAAGQVQDSVFITGMENGTGNAYGLGTSSPAITAYTAGQIFWVVPPRTNTASATFNVDTVGAVPIVKNGSTLLNAGDFVSGTAYPLYYDGTNFQAVTVQAAAVTPSQLISGTSNVTVNSTPGTISFTAAGVQAGFFSATGLTVSGTLNGATLISTSAAGTVSGSFVYSKDVSATNAYANLISTTGPLGKVSATFGYFGQISATTGVALRGFAQSNDVALAPAASANVAHGCGAVPRWTVVELVNVTADAGVTPGQVIQVPPYAGQGANIGYVVASDTTSSTVKMGSSSNPMSAANLGTGASVTLTNANWTFHVKTGC